MVGRVIGSGLLARIPAARLLALFTAIATAMCLYVVIVQGVSAGFVALCIGLFNSIMFPVIFTLTLERSSASEEATSGFLCTAIIGGALIPPLVGAVSGSVGYATALIVPAFYWGVNHVTGIFPGSFHLRPEIMVEVMVECDPSSAGYSCLPCGARSA